MKKKVFYEKKKHDQFYQTIKKLTLPKANNCACT